MEYPPPWNVRPEAEYSTAAANSDGILDVQLLAKAEELLANYRYLHLLGNFQEVSVQILGKNILSGFMSFAVFPHTGVGQG
jgi:hypothetical protein